MYSETARVEHLKLIQAGITRLAGNSFAVKSTATAASAALIAFVVSASSPFAAIGAFAILSLCLLDAYYFPEERSFRRLYDFIRKEEAAELGSDRYFTMDVSVASAESENLIEASIRKSLLLLYIPFLALIVLAGFIACL